MLKAKLFKPDINPGRWNCYLLFAEKSQKLQIVSNGIKQESVGIKI